jgi:predicted aspartyl protease
VEGPHHVFLTSAIPKLNLSGVSGLSEVSGVTSRVAGDAMMHHKLCLFLLELLTAVAAQAGSSGEIPFRLVQGFAIVVRGRVGPVKDLSFLLDTGAVPSVMSTRLAARVGAEGVKGSFRLLSEEIQARYVAVNDVCVETICSARLPMAVVDLDRFERLLGVRIDGIIGLDLLAGEDLSLDYRAKKIVRGLSGQAQHAVSAEISSAAGAPYWLLPIQVGGRTFRVLLDTGSNELGLFSRPDREADADLRNATSELMTQQLLMGDGRFEHQIEIVLKRPRGALQEIDGVLGPKALGVGRIELDWEHRRLLWSEK